MTPSDPLDALWKSDEPPARDAAFTAATMVGLPPAPRRGARWRQGLIALGVGGGMSGAMLLLQLSGASEWAFTLVAAALAAALWAGGRLIAPG